MEPRNFKRLAPAPASPSSDLGEAGNVFIPVPGPRKNLTRNVSKGLPFTHTT
ncbi:hypothetical protein F4804DRAFT_327261 [Jackrogersella minutella]|nr:hypothetical protein F4804DRAFT_327261 [Jackrogersella minutella]